MRFLIFHLGQDRYGLPAGDVQRVLPLMALTRLPGAPAYVAGLMNLHGKTVPVLDLCRLACGHDCPARFDTRILLVSYPSGDGPLPLGLIAERVSGVADVDAAVLGDSPLAQRDAPWLGRVGAVAGGLLQLIEPAALLDGDVRALLYPAHGAPR